MTNPVEYLEFHKAVEKVYKLAEKLNLRVEIRVRKKIPFPSHNEEKAQREPGEN